MTYVCGCTHSESREGYSESRDEDNRVVKAFINRINTCLRMEKRRFPVVALEHVTKRVANVKKNGFYRKDNTSTPNVTIQFTHSLLENDIIFLTPAYYKFT